MQGGGSLFIACVVCTVNSSSQKLHGYTESSVSSGSSSDYPLLIIYSILSTDDFRSLGEAYLNLLCSLCCLCQSHSFLSGLSAAGYFKFKFPVLGSLEPYFTLLSRAASPSGWNCPGAVRCYVMPR